MRSSHPIVEHLCAILIASRRSWVFIDVLKIRRRQLNAKEDFNVIETIWPLALCRTGLARSWRAACLLAGTTPLWPPKSSGNISCEN